MSELHIFFMIYVDNFILLCMKTVSIVQVPSQHADHNQVRASSVTFELFIFAL